MQALITGGCGFVGTNLAARLLERGDRVALFDNLSRAGAAENLIWLRSLGEVAFIHGDVRNAHDVERAIVSVAPDAIFHLAGQVAMTTSMLNPRADFEVNVLGSINVLETLRREQSRAVVVYASSNKVYGDLGSLRLVEEALRYRPSDAAFGVDESAPLAFETPYGCSKGAADQYMLDYARGYGVRSVVFRHSTIYGGRQFATVDQGWVGWFCRQALATRRDASREPFTISGDGKQVRDLLHVSDAVAAYLAAVEHVELAQGRAYNIGGGMSNSMSLLELFAHLESRLDVRLRYRVLPWRHSDQRFFVADVRLAERDLGWRPQTTRVAGIETVLNWESAHLPPENASGDLASVRVPVAASTL